MGGGLLAAASIGFAAVNSFAQARMAAQSAEAQQDAAKANLELQLAELSRQQDEAASDAGQAISDRSRQAARELGTLRASVEGNANAGNFARLVSDIAYFEGLDISRITENNSRRQAELSAGKTRAQQGFVNTVNTSNANASAAKTNAFLGFAGSALQIGSNYQYRQEQLRLAGNPSG